MQNVFTAQSPAEAHLVAGLLEEAGIRCVVEGEMLFGVRGDIGLTSGSLPRVCVLAADAARAADVIAPLVRRVEATAHEEHTADAMRQYRAWHALAIVLFWLLVPLALLPISLVATFVAFVPSLIAMCVHLHRYLARHA